MAIQAGETPAPPGVQSPSPDMQAGRMPAPSASSSRAGRALSLPASQAGEMPVSSVGASPTATSGAAIASAQRDLDESGLREGLRRRGLNDWLEQYLADAPAVSAVDEQLRRREALLAQIDGPATTRPQRQRLVAQAGRILAKLIADYPEHPGRLAWRFELARDKLEREDPTAFDAVLLYELPGRDRATAARLSGEAAAVLRRLREEVAGAWKTFEAMDERQMARADAAGATRPLERLDGESAYLLAWADFYQAISADLPPVERTARLNTLLETITERYGWTAPAPGREVQRAGALAMTAVALRLTKQFPAADRAARLISEVVPTVKDPAARRGLNRTVLLAVLEQVRGPRDAGRFDEARAIIDEAHKWAAQTQPGDIQTELALALAERSILARRLAGPVPAPPTATAPAAPDSAVSLLAPAEALLPLQRVAAISPAARDALYEALGGAIGEEPLAGGPFEVQLIAGASIADAVAKGEGTSTTTQECSGQPPRRPFDTETAGTEAGRYRAARSSPVGNGASTQPAGDARAAPTAATLADLVASPPAPIPAETRGELLFLEARALYLDGSPLEAVRVLGNLVEQQPNHDRAEIAARQAAAIAQETLRGGGRDPAGARAAFVRAGRILRTRLPDSPAAQQIQFFIAAALDESHRFEEAAEEYAAVPADDPHALRAARARARCLRDALNAVVATRPAGDAAAKALALRALAAARAAEEKARAATRPDACLAADITLLLAGLLDHPAIAQYEETVKALDGFEKRHAGCPAAIAPALRERMTALRQLKRMGEARAAVEEYLAADPENAGPLMARLLDAMRDEIFAAADRGETPTERTTADEAAKLAERLLAWAAAHPGRLGAGNTSTVSIWRGWAVLEAGRAKEALDIYEQAEKATGETPSANSALSVEIRLGKAECLLAMDRAAEALPMFSKVLGQVPEQSPNWWRAYVGTLGCHSRLKHDPQQIVQSIRQQRRLFPEMGAPRWARELKRIEDENASLSRPSR